MCTRARLVQADKTSRWFGMSQHDAPAGAAAVTLAGGQPAYLEVAVDPAAHGEAGLGRIARGAVVKTAGGQQLQFTVTAFIIR